MKTTQQQQKKPQEADGTKGYTFQSRLRLPAKKLGLSLLLHTNRIS